MELTNVLLRRAAAISLVCLVCVLLLAAWRGQSDIHREGLGAGQLARLTGLLATLQHAPVGAIDAQIEGLAVEEIAGRLCVSAKTVANYQTAIRQKTGLGNALEMFRYARRHALLE